MMNLTFGLFTQVNYSGPQGPLVAFRVIFMSNTSRVYLLPFLCFFFFFFFVCFYSIRNTTKPGQDNCFIWNGRTNTKAVRLRRDSLKKRTYVDVLAVL